MSDLDLEEPTRLSQSLLWDLQRQFYETRGPEAWSEKIVPTVISTNPRVARDYAAVILAWFADCACGSEETLNAVELGSGSGRLAWLVAKELERQKKGYPDLPDIRIILTDLAESNIEFWQNHPAMKRLIDEGKVDFAKLDIDEAETGAIELKLLVSGETFTPAKLDNPVAVFGNYIVDSVRQDAFKVEEGMLFESRAVAYTDENVDPEILENVKLRFEHVECALPYYNNPTLDEVLNTYKNRLNDGCFLIPGGLINTLLRIRPKGGEGDLCFISGDKAKSSLNSIEGSRDPFVATHGSISVTANFHAIALAAENLGGNSWHYGSAGSSFVNSVFVFGSGYFPRTENTAEMQLGDIGAGDAHRLYSSVHSSPGNLSIENSLGMIRLLHYDPNVFLRVAKPIRDGIPEANIRVRADIADVLERTWKNVYRIQQQDIAFEMGRIFFRINQPERAVEFYTTSLADEGEHYITYFNQGLCYQQLHRTDRARHCFEAAIKINPDYHKARKHLEDLL